MHFQCRRRQFVSRRVILLLLCAGSLAVFSIVPGTARGAGQAEQRVDEIVRNAAIAALSDNPMRLREQRSAMYEFNIKRENVGLPPSGLQDNLAWLLLILDMESTGIDAGEAETLLKWETDLLTRYQITDSLHNQPLTRLSRLYFQDRYNRVVTPVNRVLAAASGAIQGAIGPLLHAGVDLLFIVPRQFRVTPLERQRYRLASRWLRLKDLPPEAHDRLSAELERLQPRLDREAGEEYLKLADYMEDTGNLEGAESALLAARRLMPSKNQIKKQLRKVRQEQSERERGRQQSNVVLNFENFLGNRETREAYNQLVWSVALGDPATMQESVDETLAPLTNSIVEPAVHLVSSVADDIEGRREQSLKDLEFCARAYSDTFIGQKAAARAENPDYNPKVLLKQRRREHRGEKWQFVLLGKKPARNHLYLFSHSLVTPTESGLENLGVFVLADSLLRGFKLIAHNPVPPDKVVAAGERVLNTPAEDYLSSSERNDLLLKQANRLQKLEAYEAARDYYLQAGALTSDLSQKLDERQARSLLSEARQSRTVREALEKYREIVEKYPDTSAAEKAEPVLQELQERQDRMVAIPKDWISDDPDYWREMGLPIDDKWLDGWKRNRELADPSVTVEKANPEVAMLRFRKSRDITLDLPEAARQRLQAASQNQVLADRSMENFEEYLRTQRLPMELEGSVGTTGFSLYPRFRQLGVPNEPRNR